MLQAMRRSQGTKKIIMSGLVVIFAGSLALSMYGMWGGALSAKEQGAPDWIANVDGEAIPTRVFQRARASVESDMRQRFAGQLNDESLGAFVDQQALGAILGQRLLAREAARAGLRVTPAEVSDDIVNSPSWQREGKFVGVEAYRRVLAANRINVTEFEAEKQQELAADKLRNAISTLARVDDGDVERRFRAQEERVDADYVILSDTVFADAKTPSPAEEQAYFKAHASQYMSPEARLCTYVLFDRESKAASMQIPDADLKDSYEKNKASLYTHPDQRRASHILLKPAPDATPEKDAELRARATQILARIRGGEEFATVARQVSEDPGSATSGGDLGFFAKGRMVKEFEDAVFSLSVGAVSDVVKSGFGYHIIKVTDARSAGAQPFEEVRDEIRRGLAVTKAQDEIRKAAEEFGKKLASQEASFDKSASSLGYTVEGTGFFAKGEPAGKLGRLPQIDDAVFSLARGGATPPVTVPQGLAVLSLSEIRAAAPAPFESVKSRVSEDLKKSRARDKARSVASEIVSASGPLKSRAEKHKLEVKTFEKVNRMQPLPPLTEASKQAAFAASIGSVLGPFEADEGLLILEVKGKSPETAEKAAAERASLKRRMLDEERSALYQAFLGRLEKGSKIDVNDALLRQGRKSG